MLNSLQHSFLERIVKLVLKFKEGGMQHFEQEEEMFHFYGDGSCKNVRISES